jgi:hypothetical protein
MPEIGDTVTVLALHWLRMSRSVGRWMTAYLGQSTFAGYDEYIRWSTVQYPQQEERKAQ